MGHGDAPKQERSKRTLERTLAAVERLLRTKAFEAISIEEIVESAGSSVGSFYARFGSKEGLLPHLYERYDRDLRGRIDDFIDGREWAKRTIEEQTQWFASLHVDMYRKRHWLMRAVAWYSRQEPSPLPGALRKARSSLHQRITDTFEPHLDRIPGTDARAKIELGLYFIGAICRDKILFAGPHAQVTKITDAQLKKELTRMFIRFLGVVEEGSGSGASEMKTGRNQTRGTMRSDRPHL